MSKATGTVRIALSEISGRLWLEVVTPARSSRKILEALHAALASVRAFIERLEVRTSGEDVSAHLLLGASNEQALTSEHHGALMAAVVGAIDRGLQR